MLAQTPATIEWLEERRPRPPLLPASPEGRARVRDLAALVGCDVHSINNRRMLEYLRNTLGCDDACVSVWCASWINAGFQALEVLLAADIRRGNFCFSNTPKLADIYRVPQGESAHRLMVDLIPHPTIVGIDKVCAT